MNCCSCGQPIDPMAHHSDGQGMVWCWGCPENDDDMVDLAIEEPPAEPWKPNPFSPGAKRTPLK